MSRRRFFPRSPDNAPVAPFGSAEEAWFWFARCQRIRREGSRFDDTTPSVRRPCEPDDIYRCAIALFRGGVLHRQHLRILAVFGLSGQSPDPRCDDEVAAARYWDEAMDRLETPLRSKWIVE